MADFEDSSVGHTEDHIPTIIGATIDTTIYKYGNGSGYFNSAITAHVSFPDSADWTLGTTHTISGWIHIESGKCQRFSYKIDSSNWWFVTVTATQIIFHNIFGGKFVIRGDYTALSDGWHHFEVGRSGSDKYVFIDGVAVTQSSVNFGAVSAQDTLLYVGRATGIGYSFGNLDVFKIDKGICRHTIDFTPPANEDVDNDAYTVLLLKMNTIFTKINIGNSWKEGTPYINIADTWKTALKVYISLHGNATWESVKNMTWNDLLAETWDYEKQSWRTVI